MSTIGLITVGVFFGSIFSWIICKLLHDQEKRERERKIAEWMKKSDSVIKETYRRR